jgi:5'-3' exonuclease
MTDLIVDANGLYARAWYACKEDAYETVRASVNAVLGLINPERAGEPVDRTMFCWDGGQKKAKERAERPPEYEGTKPMVKRVLEALLGTANVRIEGYEADDMIATAAFASKADHVIVASGDKDLHQLQGGNISYYDLNTRGFISSREILAQWHVRRPSQVAIALAIQGDSVDKITGVRGWGPKKVEKLFEAVRSNMSFDVVLQMVEDQIPPDKLAEFQESLELTLLNSGVPGVPEPVPLRLAPEGVLVEYGLEDCSSLYAKIAELYG